MQIASLEIALGLQNVNQVLSGLNQVNAAVRQLQQTKGSAGPGGVMGNVFGSGLMGGGLRAAVYDVQALTSGLSGFMNVLGSVSGVSQAAVFKGIEAQLESVTGSASVAHEMMGKFVDFALKTPYDTENIAAFGGQLMGKGVPKDKVMGELSGITDLASWAAIPAGEMENYMRNLLQIRGKPNMQDLKQLMHVVPGIGRIVGAGMGKGPMDSMKALNALNGMTGEKAYTTILKGTEALAHGAAELAALKNPALFVANLFDNLRNVMEPTGEILLALLMPVGRLTMWLTELLVALNRATHGFAGLFALFAVGRTALPLLVVGFQAAIAKIREITTSLYLLAGAPLPAHLGGFGPGAPGSIGSKGGRFGPLGKGLLRFGVPLAADAALNFGADKIGGARGSYLSGIGNGALTGFMLAPGGPWGKLIGTIAGAIGGGLYTRYSLGSQGNESSKANVSVDKLTDAITKLTGTLVGGADRAKQTTDIMTTETALAHILYPART